MILLDTHTWIWWHRKSDSLSPKAFQAIETAIGRREEIGISAISCWEVAMLVAKGRLEFQGDVLAWIQKSLSLPEMKLLELTPAIAVLATQIDSGKTTDPADKIIMATAKFYGSPLVTKNSAMLESRTIQTIWN